MNIRPNSAGDILVGKRFLYPENLELVGGIQGKRLLDMGCGDGAEMLEWARAGAIVTGVDNSPVQLATARRNAERLGWSADWSRPISCGCRRICCKASLTSCSRRGSRRG